MIEFHEVTKVYPGGTRAVDRLTLRMESGEWWLVVGPSGGGKTTLLRLIAGLELPTTGSIRLDGVDTNRLEPHQRRVALVAQEPALYPQRTIEQNLRFGCSPEEVVFRQIVEGLEIGAWLTKLPGELSGGQRQRVALARALVRRPALLLLDEPLAQVDAPARAEIRARLPLLVGKPTPTIVHVTHDPDEALDLADHLALLLCGNLEQAGRIEEVRRQPRSAWVRQFLQGVRPRRSADRLE